MTNPLQICTKLTTLRGSLPATLEGSGSLPLDPELAELSAEGWQTELVNRFTASMSDGSLTVDKLMASLEEDGFVRDFVAAQTLSRRRRVDHLLQINRQRAVDVSPDGQLEKQWRQIGTNTYAPTEEETIDER